MRLRVGSAPHFADRLLVSSIDWPGLGVPYEAIPTDGDDGATPLANDGISAGHEYRIEVVTWPSAGTLTLYPDLSFNFSGAPDGVYTWSYRLYEDGVDQGVTDVTMTVGDAVTHIAAAGVMVSTGAGNIAVAVDSSAVGVSIADGAAGLTATVTISAAGLAEAAGVAGLTVSSGGELIANGAVVASGTAVLAVTITLQATGSAESGGSAALVGGAAEVTLTAAGYSQALAAGEIVVDVALSGAGSGLATGFAAISGGPVLNIVLQHAVANRSYRAVANRSYRAVANRSYRGIIGRLSA